MEIARSGLSSSGLVEGEHVDPGSAAAVKRVLETLLSVGFARARYWTVSNGEDEAVAELAMGIPEAAHHVGYKATLRSSALGALGDIGSPVVIRDPGTLTQAAQPWVQDLQLTDSGFVEIPVRAGDQLLGILAGDWPMGSKEPPLDAPFLDHVAGRIAEALVSPRIEFSESLNRLSIQAGPGRADFISASLPVVRDAVGGGMLAAFRFNVATGLIEKVAEDPPKAVFHEAYRPGDYLTGSAWVDPELHNIPDASQIRRLRPNLIHDDSWSRHSEMVGPLRGIMYRTIGTSEQRYLLRVINRADEPTAPFTAFNQERFTAISQLLSNRLGEVYAQERLMSLQSLALAALNPDFEVDHLLDIFIEHVKSEGFDSFALLAETADSGRITVMRWRGPEFLPSGRMSPILPTDLRLPPFRRVADARADLYVGLPIALVTRTSRPIETALVVPSRVGRTKGWIVIPTRHKPTDVNADRQHLRTYHETTLGHLETCSRLIVGAVDGASRRLTADDALDLVQTIVHEFRSPLKTIADASKILSSKGQAPDEHSDTLSTKRVQALARLTKASERINRTIGVLVQSANFGDAKFRFVLTETNAYDLLRNIVNDEQNKAATVSLDLKTSGSGLLVFDRPLMEHLLRNIVGNAIKYSTPKGGTRPVVRIAASRDTGWFVLRVSNTGPPIPTEWFERIFDPFQRVPRPESVAGSGLGLYLAKLIALAHEGKVTCLSCEPTGDGRYLSVFEVRIPDRLKAEERRVEVKRWW